MARYTYPINTLGADYIHSNQDNFVETFQSNAGLNTTEKTFEFLKGKLKLYMKKEMEFYEAAEKAFIAQIKENVKGTDLESKLRGRKSILKHINNIYKKEQENKKSGLGQLVAAKNQIQLWQMSWYNKWYKSSKGKNLDAKQFEKYAKMIPKIIEGLLASVDIIELERKKENESIFDKYKATQMSKEIKTKEELEKEMSKSLQDIIGSKKDIKQLKEIAKQGIDQKSMKKILVKLVDIMAKVYVSINQKFGLLAEKFSRELVNSSMSFLTNMEAKVVGNTYKQFQVMDVQTMEISVGSLKNVKIGFSQKFTKYLKFTKGYSNIDIFDTLAAYAKAKDEKKLFDTIENKKPFIMYLRRNIIALSTFNLGKKDLSNALDPYIKLEKELALIRGFTRFFNQYLILAENGELAPFNNKNIIGYNSLIVYKQGIFWMKDFIELAFNSIDSNVVDGTWKGSVFKGRADLKNFDKVAGKKSQLANLWNKKLKILRQLEGDLKTISYKDLLNGTEEEIKKVFRGRGKNPKLIDGVAYTLDASKMKSSKK